VTRSPDDPSLTPTNRFSPRLARLPVLIVWSAVGSPTLGVVLFAQEAGSSSWVRVVGWAMLVPAAVAGVPSAILVGWKWAVGLALLAAAVGLGVAYRAAEIAGSQEIVS
jgi:hypothetical protein